MGQPIRKLIEMLIYDPEPQQNFDFKISGQREECSSGDGESEDELWCLSIGLVTF